VQLALQSLESVLDLEEREGEVREKGKLGEWEPKALLDLEKLEAMEKRPERVKEAVPVRFLGLEDWGLARSRVALGPVVPENETHRSDPGLTLGQRSPLNQSAKVDGV